MRRLHHRRARRRDGKARPDVAAVHRGRSRRNDQPAQRLQRRRSTQPAENLSHAAHVPRDLRPNAKSSADAGGTVSTATTTSRLVPELRAICGAQYVIEETAAWLRPKSEDPNREAISRFLDKPLPIAVTPGSVDEVAAILRLANQQGFSVFPAGFAEFRPPRSAEVMLLTTRLTDVEHYDPADLTVGVGAGMTVGQLNAMVGKDHLLFGVDPPFPERATIGGVLATSSHGPLRHGYGGLRDFCLGVRFVTGDGRKAKGGGRVVKNVAGYDMMKLLIGSQGTLAVIIGASFKLFPAPRQTRTFVAVFSSAAEALQFRSQVLRSPLDPICLELVSPQAHELLAPASPAAAGWSICLRAAGSETVLARYRTELGSAVAREMEGANEQGFWRALDDFSPLAAERHPRSLSTVSYT